MVDMDKGLFQTAHVLWASEAKSSTIRCYTMGEAVMGRGSESDHLPPEGKQNYQAAAPAVTDGCLWDSPVRNRAAPVIRVRPD